MNADGRWKVTAATPAGPQAMQLKLVTQGDSFSGEMTSPMGDMNVAGSVNGNILNWVMQISKPISMKVTFEVVVDGDIMTGTAKMGFLGKAKLNGERIAADAASDAPSSSKDPVGPVTESSIDPQFNEAFIAVNELRNEPVPHRYVQGGFKGTDARFSFYFPPKERYQGRFFHNTYPMALTSDIGPFPIAFDVAIGDLGFTIDSGAYYVQTNLGGADRAPPADMAIAAYRVNAAAAKYSRMVAAELYGAHRPYGYLFGGSGGSYQVMGSAENTSGVWDGFIPFVIGTPNAIPSMFTVRMHALRVLRQRNKFAAIVDAINPGGSGDPYTELNEEERAALKEVSSMGYPLRGWFAHETLNSGYFYNVAPLIPMLDPTYVDDFWNKPGYLGSDPAIKAARFHFDTTIVKVIDGFPKQLVLADVPRHDFADAHLVMMSGAAKGKSVALAAIDGNTVGFAYAADHAVIDSIQAGDQVRIDNSWVLALQTYHRHQLPTTDMYGWNQFRDAKGEPLYPQRDVMIGPLSTAGTAGSIPDGHINGKVLVVGCLIDIDALPWQADWYRSQVQAALGSRFDDNFALWYIDHAQHDNPQTAIAKAHIVGFSGVLQQALRDLSAWVEQGIKPSSTQYQIVDAQVHVPDSAAQRKGVQPVIELQANGSACADVAINQTVTFIATVEVPPGAGKVIAAEWDFEGAGNFPVTATIDAPHSQVRLTAAHSYAKPGTYFAVLRATSQRQGDVFTPYARIQNLARVRVVVK